MTIDIWVIGGLGLVGLLAVGNLIACLLMYRRVVRSVKEMDAWCWAIQSEYERELIRQYGEKMERK